MHICYLCSEYPPGPHGGVGTFTQTLGRALVKRGHAVTVVGFDRGLKSQSMRSIDEGVVVVRLPVSRIPHLRALSSTVSLQREINTIHSHQRIDVLEGPELSMAFLPRGVSPKKVIRMHGGHHFFSHDLGHKARPLRSWLERRSFRNADSLCAVSQHVAGVTSRLLGLEDHNIEILPNPVDTVHFSPQPQIAEVPGRIVFVGTICEKKGVRQLIRAMPKILERHPQAQLHLIGRDWRDPSTGRNYTDEMRELAARLAPAHVAFLGKVDNDALPIFLAAASVCVMPSHAEAMSLTWLEALSVGRPLVASRAGPGPEVVEHGVSGLLCDPHDAKSIAACVSTLLGDPAFRARLGHAARERALKYFSQQALAIKNENFYLQCAQGNAQRH